MTRMAERPTRWIELSVSADAESVESVTELLSRYGYNQGVVVEEPYSQDEDGERFEIDPTRPVIVRTFLPDDEHAATQIQVIEEGLWHLGQIGHVGQLSRAVREEEDWANAWKQHFQVLRIGEWFVIRPSWCDYDPQPSDLVIHLDPGMAFGTGSHPSTSLCLLLMEGLDFIGTQVLDAGAGSGILSIGAILLGAEHVDAIEIDAYAAKALAANVDMNEMGDRITTIVGPVDSTLQPDARYDIVLANMIARLLVENVESLTRPVTEHGAIIASGIIQEREAMVVQAFSDYGFRPVDRRQEGDWVALRLEHEPAAA